MYGLFSGFPLLSQFYCKCPRFCVDFSFQLRVNVWSFLCAHQSKFLVNDLLTVNVWAFLVFCRSIRGTV